jgi:hypothetical protein
MKPKKIKQSIESLEKQKEKHLEKIETYDGKNPFLIEYWKKEINSFNYKIKELKERLEK